MKIVYHIIHKITMVFKENPQFLFIPVPYKNYEQETAAKALFYSITVLNTYKGNTAQRAAHAFAAHRLAYFSSLYGNPCAVLPKK